MKIKCPGCGEVLTWIRAINALQPFFDKMFWCYGVIQLILLGILVVALIPYVIFFTLWVFGIAYALICRTYAFATAGNIFGGTLFILFFISMSRLWHYIDFYNMSMMKNNSLIDQCEKLTHENKVWNNWGTKQWDYILTNSGKNDRVKVTSISWKEFVAEFNRWEPYECALAVYNFEQEKISQMKEDDVYED